MTANEETGFAAKRIKEIAALFPGATLNLDGDGNARGFNLGPEEVIYIGYNTWGHKGHRFHIHGGWPSRKVGGGVVTPRDVDYHAASPAISLDAAKTPEQIKRDIERRFLPAYRELLAKCIEVRNRGDQYARNQDSTVTELVRLFRGEVYGHAKQNVNLRGRLNGEIEVSGTTGTLKIRSLSLAQLRELAPLLLKWQDAQEEIAA